jgi:hypothetical protein
MNIALLLFCFETELADYLDADRGAADDIRLELTGLLKHVAAVRSVLDGQDDWPDSEQRRVSIAIQSDADEWDQQN